MQVQCQAGGVGSRCDKFACAGLMVAAASGFQRLVRTAIEWCGLSLPNLYKTHTTGCSCPVHRSAELSIDHRL